MQYLGSAIVIVIKFYLYQEPKAQNCKFITIYWYIPDILFVFALISIYRQVAYALLSSFSIYCLCKFSYFNHITILENIVF